MKKFFKIFLMTLLSVFLLLVITFGIASWLIFTPERVTPIVQRQADKFISCQTEIEEVEITFFSTYPNLGLKLKQIALINPVAGFAGDTLFRVDEFVAIVDAKAWWKRKELILVELDMTGGSFHVFSDSLGNANYDVFVSDSASSTGKETGSAMPFIDLQKVVLDDINLHYNDLSSKLNAAICGLDAEISGSFTENSISGRLQLSGSGISIEHNGEKYVEQASIQVDLPVDVIPSRQFINLKNASLSLNDLLLSINGTLENDTLTRTITTDIRYEFRSSLIENILKLVPASYHSRLTGIEANGLMASEGHIRGRLNDSIMPLLDIRLLLENGTLDYEDFSLPLHDVQADIVFYSDLKTDSISYIRIDRFDAKTPMSYVQIKGEVDQLFSDPLCNLTAYNSLMLGEFAPMLPDSLNICVRGNTAGKINAAFSLDQLRKMQLERMLLSGNQILTDFYAVYDSLSIETDRTKINFHLPNRNASSKDADFVFASIHSDNLKADKPENYFTFLQNAIITLQTSDFRDTARLPDVLCSFALDSLYAAMDTLSLALKNPGGKVLLAPRSDAPGQSRIDVSYQSGKIKTTYGQNSAVLEDISLEADILNDNSQEDVFLQWLASGSIGLKQGSIRLRDYTHDIEIPSVEMNFDHESLNIQEASVRLDKSDFRLRGDVRNVLSYFRGDSILRGNFWFTSDTTDVEQMLALTSGLGGSDTATTEHAVEESSNTGYSGPYMVPEGIDFLLNADIGVATMGLDTATDIMGDIRVRDGILVLDGLRFKTPAARMQLTSMYRTPRKNHIYAGLDYHMLDVEIEELLNMIPDIDTLMPMLRSFRGEAEFHIAIETYLDSLYNIKKSTLRGASSIRGNDLVLMDGETFSEISQKLRFSKKAENRVDSLSAEFTIFRNEIDIYPFLIVMDKYKAVVAGRHNFDMSFDYHVSLVESPLPVKLGLDIKGDMKDMNVDLAKCQYPELYRPTARGAVENKQLQLRQMIRDLLTQKVKE